MTDPKLHSPRSGLGAVSTEIIPNGRSVILDPETMDLPRADADLTRVAPMLSKGSPKPLTLESITQLVASITTQNPYSVMPGVSIGTLSDTQGNPAALSDATAIAHAFDSGRLLEIIAGETFTPEEIASFSDPQLGLNELLKSIVGPTGNDANPGSSQSYESTGRSIVPTPGGATRVQKTIVSSVLSRNRFTGSEHTPFVPPGAAASSIDKNPIGGAQLSFGIYKNDATPVTYEQMKKIGLALMLRATGQFVGADGDPTSLGVGAASLIPGEAQLGVTRISRRKMWASELTAAQGAPTDLDRDGKLPKQESEFGFDTPSSETWGSYGNLNSFIEPFGGFAPVGMVLLAEALVIALRVAMAGLFFVFSLVNLGNTLDRADPDPKPLGSANPRQKAITKGAVTPEDFGIHGIKNDYLTAVNRGLDAFFQLDQITSSALRVAKSPGYYVTLIRALLLSAGNLGRSIKDAVGAGNPIAAAQALIGIVDVIKSSKIIGFFNVLAGIGDNIIELERKGIIVPQTFGLAADPSIVVNNGKISLVDNLIENAASRISKSRTGDGSDLRLAWRTAATPSSFLIPAQIIKASQFVQRAGSVVNPSGLAEAASVADDIDTTARMDPARTKDLEDRLDAEHVPFYFHDLRTNEIVSFHAFLASLNDNFAGDWSKDKYYGRIDPVLVYGSTERTISLSFHVVSTREDDFDIMWWKINKLVTLLYPQWTRGNKLTVGQDTFIQPFSQVISSSPIIRLRIGDVIRSNYSKFALMRLFGFGTEDFKLQGVDKIKADQQDKIKAHIDARISIKAKMLENPARNPQDSTLGFSEGASAILKPGPNDLSLKLKSVGAGVASPPGAPALAAPTPALGPTRPSPVTVGPKKVELGSTTYEVTFKTPLAGFSPGPYLVNHNQLAADDAYVEAQATLAAPLPGDDATTLSNQQTELDKFFDNSITRSFESVAGRGLAGAITSMNFDWKTPTWDTTRLGSRAPQWCLVTMNFQPIHDIPPGIDADGFNRAPVYNVGDMVRSIGGDPFDDGKNQQKFDAAKDETIKNIKSGASLFGPLVKG